MAPSCPAPWQHQPLPAAQTLLWALLHLVERDGHLLGLGVLHLFCVLPRSPLNVLVTGVINAFVPDKQALSEWLGLLLADVPHR